MEKESVNTVKYSASINAKFAKIALSLGLTKRMLFEKMVDYFHRTKKDPSDINDDLLKNSFAKSHKTYTSFIKTQEAHEGTQEKQFNKEEVHFLEKVNQHF